MYKIFFTQIHSLSNSLIFAKLALALSYPVTYLLVLFLLIWAIFYSARSMYSFSLLFLTGITAWFAAHFIKVMMQIPRPFVEMNFAPLHPETGFSFPSEHMTILTALAFATVFLNKRLGGVVILLAVCIGVSRIIIGVHYPVDIAAGMVLGYLVHWPFRKLFDKF